MEIFSLDISLGNRWLNIRLRQFIFRKNAPKFTENIINHVILKILKTSSQDEFFFISKPFEPKF